MLASHDREQRRCKCRVRIHLHAPRLRRGIRHQGRHGEARHDVADGLQLAHVPLAAPQHCAHARPPQPLKQRRRQHALRGSSEVSGNPHKEILQVLSVLVP